MTERAIGANALFNFLTEQLVKETGQFTAGVNKGLNIARSAVKNQQITPTLSHPNEVLTLEQLQQMDGEPAWWETAEGSCWGIIAVDSSGIWKGRPFFQGRWRECNFKYDIEMRCMTIYRFPPKNENVI